MAKFTSPIFSTASGKMAGIVFSRNRYGMYVRKYAIPVNPATTPQGIIRVAFQTLSNGWKALTQAQRDSWIAGAPSFPQTLPDGSQQVLSGQALYVKFNTVLNYAGVAAVNVCPSPQDVAYPGSLSVTTLTNASIILDADLLVVPAGTIFLVEATHGVSAGVNFVGRSAFKRIAVLVATDDLSDELITPYTAVFGAPVTGAKVFFRVTGTLTNSGQSLTTNIAQSIV